METMLFPGMSVIEKLLLLGIFGGFMFTIFGFAGWLGKHSKDFGFWSLVGLAFSFIMLNLLTAENNKRHSQISSLKQGWITAKYTESSAGDTHYFVVIQGAVDKVTINKKLEIEKKSFEEFQVDDEVQIVPPTHLPSLLKTKL